MSHSPIIKTTQLTKTFNKGKNNEVTPVQNIHLEILPQTCTVIKGASGSGKTTLLSLLGGLTKPTAGEIICKSEAISRWSEKFLTRFRRENIGIVFQNFQLVNGLSTAYNIALPLLPIIKKNKIIHQKVEEIAEQVGISHRLNFPVQSLSGGEQQRVAIARALVNSPSILIADEPTAHLDSDNSINILDILHNLKQKDLTIILSTHDVMVQNHKVTDSILFIKDGKMG